jgi:hypothetical protein
VVLQHLLLGTLAFLLTFAETIVSTWEGRADRQSTSCRDNRFSKKAAAWAGVFEALLLVDVVLVVHEPVLYSPPILAAAIIGKYWSLEKRREKFRRRVKRKKQPQQQEKSHGSDDA